MEKCVRTGRKVLIESTHAFCPSFENSMFSSKIIEVHSFRILKVWLFCNNFSCKNKICSQEAVSVCSFWQINVSSVSRFFGSKRIWQQKSKPTVSQSNHFPDFYSFHFEEIMCVVTQKYGFENRVESILIALPGFRTVKILIRKLECFFKRIFLQRFEAYVWVIHGRDQTCSYGEFWALLSRNLCEKWLFGFFIPRIRWCKDEINEILNRMLFYTFVFLDWDLNGRSSTSSYGEKWFSRLRLDHMYSTFWIFGI